MLARSTAWKQENPKRARDQASKQSRTTRLRQYGMTMADYTSLAEIQGEACAICGLPMTARRRLAVDHDHATGKVRGLLCVKCNAGLGMFLESAGLLRLAIAYLADPPTSKHEWRGVEEEHKLDEALQSELRWIAELSEAGKTQRQIVIETGLSLGAVNRRIKIARSLGMLDRSDVPLFNFWGTSIPQKVEQEQSRKWNNEGQRWNTVEHGVYDNE